MARCWIEQRDRDSVERAILNDSDEFFPPRSENRRLVWVCICFACNYLDHRDHELTDVRTAAANHKAYIVECLDGC